MGGDIRRWYAIGIGLVWGAAAIVAFFSKNYEELGIVSPVMMIVTGFVFGFRSGYQNNNSSKNGGG